MLGRTFGRLTVKSIFGTGSRGTSWLCLCDCGVEVKRSTSQLNGELSCGCAITHSEKRVSTPRKLRLDHEITFVSWKAMLARCHYAKNKQKCYKNIEICDDWFDFKLFLRDMGDRPSLEYSIDRKNAKLGYNKENCQWLLKTENSAKQTWTDERKAATSARSAAWFAAGNKRIFTDEMRAKIAEGAVKRVGRTLTQCQQCGRDSYLPVCQRCKGERK